MWGPEKIQSWWAVIFPILNWLGAWALISHEAVSQAPQLWLIMGAWGMLGLPFFGPWNGRPPA